MTRNAMLQMMASDTNALESPLLERETIWIGEVGAAPSPRFHQDIQRAHYFRSSLAVFSIMVPPWTCMLTLVPTNLTDYMTFLTDSPWPIVVSFWVVAALSICASYFFLTRLSHVWTLEYFASRLGDQGIVIRFDVEPYYWKSKVGDKLLLGVAGTVVLLLLATGNATEAAAVGLQLGITLRNAYEGLLTRPSVKLPLSCGQLTVVPEQALREAVTEFLDKSCPQGFTFQNLSDSVLAKSMILATSSNERSSLKGQGPSQGCLSTEPWTQKLVLTALEIDRQSNLRKCHRRLHLCCVDKCGQQLEEESEIEEVLREVVDELVPQLTFTSIMINIFTNGQIVLAVAFITGRLVALAIAWTETPK